MALPKHLVILFLVYLNFEISPVNSAAIPESSPDSVFENDDITTEGTGATEDDIEKIFETYENLYMKNSNWYNDDKLSTNANNQKSLATKSEEESTNLGTTEPTADEVVESVQNIIDEKVDAKTNRTDRTIVVVVTTNVFNINGSDDTSRRQHTLLSFGTPGMLQRESSTDRTLAMHNKITTEFFNSNTSPISEKSGIVQTPGSEKSIEAETIDSHDLTENSINIVPVTEAEESDVVTTETPQNDYDYDYDHVPQNNIDIRSNFNAVAEGRSIDDELSNDIVGIVKIVPNRSDDKPGNLLKSFELQEPQDSSLMEAMENILDTDVRKAFERDIPQTRHVPLDINIEEEALYAPLKDLSEYIVEEVPVNGNYEIFIDNARHDDLIEKVVESLTKSKELGDSLKNVGEAVTERDQTTTTTTTTTNEITEEATISTITTKEAAAAETTTLLYEEVKGMTFATDGLQLDVAGEPVDTTSVNLNEVTPSTYSGHSIETPIPTEEILKEESSVMMEKLKPRSGVLELPVETVSYPSEDDKTENNEEIAASTDGNESLQTNLPKKRIFEPFITVKAIRILEHHATDDATEALVENSEKADDLSESTSESYEKLADNYFDQHPMFTHSDTTTDFYVTNPNLYIGALLTHDQVATFLKAVERASSLLENAAPFDDLLDTRDSLNEAEKEETELEKTYANSAFSKVIKILESTTTKPDEDVVSEVVKVDEQTTEQHEIIKKHGVDGTLSEDSLIDNDADDESKSTTKVTDVVSNDLVETKTTNFEGRSFVDIDDDPVDALRTLVEGAELTVDITKSVDTFQSLTDPNDPIHLAANQVIENKNDLGLVESAAKLNSEESVWCVTTAYIALGVLSIGLIVSLGVVSYLRFRQFKRNILFTC